MKKILILTILFSISLPVSATDISYTIIENTSENKVSIVINNITKKTNYSCDLSTYVCEKIKEQNMERKENPLKKITLSFLEDRDADLAKVKKEQKNIESPAPATTAPSLQKNYGEFSIPQKATHVVISPDKKKIAYFLEEGDMVVTKRKFIIEFENGKKLEYSNITNNLELLRNYDRLFYFSEDNSKLVYLDDRTGFAQLYLVDFKQKPRDLSGKQIIKKPYTVYDFVIKGEKVYYIANRQEPNKWSLYSLSLKDGKLNIISEDVMYTNKLELSGNNILFTTNEQGTGVLKSFNTKENKVKNFIGIEQERTKVANIIRENIFTENVKGVLLKPDANKDLKKAVIWLHGGPYRQASLTRHPWGSYATYDWILDELVSTGVTVLKLDYPGSMGYGKDYSLSLVNNIGVTDVESLKHTITYLNNLGLKKIYLFGNSYGGYLALKSVIELDDKLSGAIAVAPVTDWQKLIERVHPTPFEAYFEGMPNENNRELYDKASIVKNLEKLTKPIVLFHGELDNQVPFGQSEYLFKEMKKTKKKIQYYSVVSQGHVINGVSQNETICEKVVEFMGIKKTEDICKMQ